MPTFTEIQKMNQWWLWLILLGIAGLWTWAIVQQIMLGQPFGDKPASDTELLVAGLFVLGILGLFYVLTLHTEISAAGIRLRYVPFVRKTIPWSEIRRAEVIRYIFVGYGIRLSFQYGIVYNTRGNQGLLLEKTDGKRLLIGTQQPEALAAAVRAFLPQTVGL